MQTRQNYSCLLFLLLIPNEKPGNAELKLKIIQAVFFSRGGASCFGFEYLNMLFSKMKAGK